MELWIHVIGNGVVYARICTCKTYTLVEPRAICYDGVRSSAGVNWVLAYTQ